jgi:hypothetical protein
MKQDIIAIIILAFYFFCSFIAIYKTYQLRIIDIKKGLEYSKEDLKYKGLVLQTIEDLITPKIIIIIIIHFILGPFSLIIFGISRTEL